MDCECCGLKINDVRDYFEYELVTGNIITCELCYNILQEGQIGNDETIISMTELISALPS
jgi:hypothetical protein